VSHYPFWPTEGLSVCHAMPVKVEQIVNCVARIVPVSDLRRGVMEPQEAAGLAVLLLLLRGFRAQLGHPGL